MYTRDIKQWISSLKDGSIILAKTAYENYFSDMKEATFYQLLARLNEEKYIGKIAKGLYFKPYKRQVDNLPEPSKLLDFFTSKYKNGMLIGGKMLLAKGIIKEDNNPYYNVITNTIEIKTKRYISNLVIETVDIDYRNSKVRESIEMLEMIEIIDEYDNYDKNKLDEFIEAFAKNYNEATFNKVLNAKTYKKRNIAAVKLVLDYYNVANNLSKQLNTASKYQLPGHFLKYIEQ